MGREKQTAARHAGRQRQRSQHRAAKDFIHDELAAFAAAMKLPPADRETYFERRRQESRVRLEKMRTFLPVLDKVNPQLAGCFRQTIEALERIDSVLEGTKPHATT